jgi:hypothetical protein
MTKAFWALAVFLVIAAFGLPASASAKPCKCENFDALKGEIALALRLKAAYAAKAAELRAKYGDKPAAEKKRQANDDYQQFIKGNKQSAGGQSGTGTGQTLKATEYVPAGTKYEEQNVRSGGKEGIPDGKKLGSDQYTREPDPAARCFLAAVAIA